MVVRVFRLSLARRSFADVENSGHSTSVTALEESCSEFVSQMSVHLPDTSPMRKVAASPR